MKRRNAYTLIELLVAITIIGILMTIAAVGWSSVAARSRDDTRKTDMRRIKNMLEQYYADNRAYPVFETKTTTDGRAIFSAQWQLTNTSASFYCRPNSDLTNRLAPKYANTVPAAPKAAKDLSQKYCDDIANTQDEDYFYLSASSTGTPEMSPKDYALMVKLEKAPSSGSNDYLATTANPLNFTDYNGTTYAGYKTYNPWDHDKPFSDYLSPNYMVVKGTAE